MAIKELAWQIKRAAGTLPLQLRREGQLQTVQNMQQLLQLHALQGEENFLIKLKVQLCGTILKPVLIRFIGWPLDLVKGERENVSSLN